MNDSQIAATVDHLGDIKAEIAELKQVEAGLKKFLINAGIDSAEGDLFRATVAHTVRSTLHAATVRAFLTAQQIVKATRSTDVTTVRVTARTGAT